jgi:hypothetical protein
MKRVLILNDGEKLNIYRCGSASNILWIGIEDEKELLPIAKVLSDKKKTVKMISKFEESNDDGITYDGYTDLKVLQKDGAGVLAALGKES